MPLVTVVTAARNAQDFLPETIESIRSQTLDDWEYVVVDDASTDATAEVAERFSGLDSRIRVKRLPESVGAYAAANPVMLEADCRYLARIDADDLATPRRLETQVGLLDRNRHLAASTCAAELFSAGGPKGLRGVPAKSNGVIKWMLWLRNCLVHSTLVVTKDKFAELGGYGPELVSEDHRVWGALARQGVLSVTDDVLVRYRLHDAQITSAGDSRELPARARVTWDHMTQCTSDTWSLDDARDLTWIGEHTTRFGPDRALELLTRFESSWQKDVTLTSTDRDQLRALTARRTLRHLRHNLKANPAEVTSAAMRRAPAVVRAAMRTARDRSGQRWP